MLDRKREGKAALARHVARVAVEKQRAASQALEADESGTDVPEAGAQLEVEEPLGPVRLAIMGLPNVGKSTLLNRVLGEERVVTGPEPGLT
eukprot:CAMPEP_0119115228 /NCGR_PEP_ID=MMETSP1180-20130426/50220_1 /TAXON_ID=3052 ORGANISM="Chlamydomonas cf sp, Strain CCMP681" /NCGR_SAMPLE_ID=MMETSP1180 /ASSEMBLY_ACC=CAM_ASM_000741 /LENGTH=90 /DNA_ID=CAMNT_0007104099 /DNA_START=21 /DNA_END=289 /DNA_ORIENTATION=+